MSIQTSDERKANLLNANMVRKARVQLKARLHEAGRYDAPDLLAALLREPPPELASADIGEVLHWTPGWGSGRVDELLERTRINPLATIASERVPSRGARARVAVLTQRQRDVIIAELRRR